MTKRLPRALKKKLEANLKDLTPRQAGRLWLIYFLENVKNGFPTPNSQYPPIKELKNAWEERYQEARKKGAEEGNRQAALHNGFVFLQNLVLESNRFATSDSWRVLFKVHVTTDLVEDLLSQDWVGEVARFATGLLIDESPLPASHEEYNRITQWAEGEALESIDYAVDTIMEAWAESQGFVDLEDSPKNFFTTLLHDRREEVESLFARIPEENEENVRHLFVEYLGDDLLTGVFKGDREALEDWVKAGGFAGPGLTADKWKTKSDEIEKQLIDLIKAGDLEGGLATYPDDCFDAVLIEDDCIPAWAILRSIWRRWLYDHDHLIRDTATLTEDTLRGVWQIYTVEGDVEEDALVTLAAEFFADCKAKPWGEGLVESSQVAFDALARFLIEDANPLTQYHAPDLGRVNLAEFEAAEEGPIVTEDWAATVRSLKAKAADFGVKPEEFNRDWVKEYYYPTDKPEGRRRSLALVTRLLGNLRVSHRAFTYKRKDEDQTKTPLNTFFGVDFTTPLEVAVKSFGECYGTVATFKRIFELISEEYFGGLPLFMPETADRIESAEAMLSFTEDKLAGWLERIEKTWPDVDLTSLRVVKAEVGEENAKEYADMLIESARRDLGRDTEIDLGPDDEAEEPIKIRKASRRRLAPIAVEAGDDEGGEE